MLQARKALRTKMFEHVEREFAERGKSPGAKMEQYVKEFESLSSLGAFNDLLAKITNDAQQEVQ